METAVFVAGLLFILYKCIKENYIGRRDTKKYVSYRAQCGYNYTRQQYWKNYFKKNRIEREKYLGVDMNNASELCLARHKYIDKSDGAVCIAVRKKAREEGWNYCNSSIDIIAIGIISANDDYNRSMNISRYYDLSKQEKERELREIELFDNVPYASVMK